MEANLNDVAHGAPLYPDLVMMLFQQSVRCPERMAIQFHRCIDTPDNLVWTYADLWRQAKLAGIHLARLGVRKGDRVVILLPNGAHFVESFFGALSIGAVPVPYSPEFDVRHANRFITKLVGVVADCQASCCVTLDRFAASLQQYLPSLNVLPFSALEAECSDVEEGLGLEIDPEDVAFIQYTSGSTSAPKGVVLSHRNLLTNIHDVTEVFATDGNRDVAVSWLPLYHDMGLIGLLMSALYSGVPFHLMSPHTFIKSPKLWFEVISRYRGTLTSAPNFAYGLCTRRCDVEGLDLSSLRVLLNGAEPIDYTAILSFVEKFKVVGLKLSAITPAYGLAESTVAVSFALGEQPKVDEVDYEQLQTNHIAVPLQRAGGQARSIVCVGKPIPSGQVRIVGEDGHAVGDGVVGQVQVKGPSVMKQYYGKAHLNPTIFHDGWLVTGDLGYMKAGELYITGRVKDLIIYNGKNYYPHDIEREMMSIEAVRAGRVAVFWLDECVQSPGGLVALLEAKATQEIDVGDLLVRVKRTIVEATSIPVRDVKIIPHGAIPLTSSGKVRRQPARQMYLSGEFN